MRRRLDLADLAIALDHAATCRRGLGFRVFTVQGAKAQQA